MKKVEYNFGVNVEDDGCHYFIYKKGQNPIQCKPYLVGGKGIGYVAAEKLGKKIIDKLNKGKK